MLTKEQILKSTLLSKHAYSKRSQIPWKELGIEKVRWIQDRKTDTQGFVVTIGTDIFVVWRGSESPTDFLKDASVLKVKAFGDCKVHSGFYSCLTAVQDRLGKHLKEAIQEIGGISEVSRVYVSGHSLGGALATLSAVQISTLYPSLSPRLKVITIGSPRVGNRAFKTLFNKQVSEHIRVVHDNDIVTRVPKLNYFHVGTQLKLSDNGQVMTNNLNALKHLIRVIKANLTANSFQDHRVDNYLSALEKWDGILK